MRLTKAVEGFVHSRTADGYAPITLRGYRSSLGTLAEYLKDPDVDTITTEQLKEFMHYLHTSYKPERPSGSMEPLATASYHRYWKAIRSFFKWSASSEGIGTGRPDLELRMPQFTNKEIKPLTSEDIAKLLKACEIRKPVLDGTRKPYQCQRPNYLINRDKALIMVLIDTGVRSGECARLCIKDVNLDSGEVSVLPYHVRKTRPRTVYLGKSARKAVWRYLAMREDANPEDPLFVTAQNKPMCQASIKSVLYAISQNAKVSNVHPHRFRHTFAIFFLRNGGDVFNLQRMLGHATFDMVKKYLALANSDGAEAHRKASPIDRLNL